MAFTSTQKTELLFKKLIGAPSTNENNAFYSEPIRPARPSVFQSQFYSESIPNAVPTELANASTDDLGNALDGSLVGKSYPSAAAPVIKKYSKVVLTEVAGSNGAAYEAPLDATYGRVLQDAIPFNMDSNGSYLFTLYKQSGAVIPAGSGQWVVDCESGIVSFYSLGSITGVSASQPPSISFYRYVGAKGAQTATQTIESIRSQPIEWTAPDTFVGGDVNTTGDDLAAIVLDDRNLTTLSNTTPAMSLQLGGDYDGSWRLCVVGGSNTSLQFQVRSGGVWISKSSMFNQ
ncbi:hypothetical protein JKP88DRAFT_240994 [Tribonema minus]|uniref:Uncharacterized protein n=1 Tax=Tribonema minus TaxID=303371 RepID=A0A835Z3L1_9STRA|nr:hypothetical protein JKP88DRAFT_240994 [Tribonema minus]